MPHTTKATTTFGTNPSQIENEKKLRQKDGGYEGLYSDLFFNYFIVGEDKNQGENLKNLFDQIDACGNDPTRLQQKKELVQQFEQYAHSLLGKNKFSQNFTHSYGADGSFYATIYTPFYAITCHIYNGKLYYDFFAPNPKFHLFLTLWRLDGNGGALNLPARDILCFRNTKLEAATNLENRGYSCVKEFVNNALSKEAAQKLGNGLHEGKTPEIMKKISTTAQEVQEKLHLTIEKYSINQKVSEVKRSINLLKLTSHSDVESASTV